MVAVRRRHWHLEEPVEPRQVDDNDPTEASEIVTLVDLLMRILDRMKVLENIHLETSRYPAANCRSRTVYRWTKAASGGETKVKLLDLSVAGRTYPVARRVGTPGRRGPASRYCWRICRGPSRHGDRSPCKPHGAAA